MKPWNANFSVQSFLRKFNTAVNAAIQTIFLQQVTFLKKTHHKIQTMELQKNWTPNMSNLNRQNKTLILHFSNSSMIIMSADTNHMQRIQYKTKWKTFHTVQSVQKPI